MDLRIEIDVTPRVESLVEMLIKVFGEKGITVPDADDRHAPAVTEPAIPARVKNVEAEKPTETECSAPMTADVTDEELRQHMDMAISKFAGNGWKNNTDDRTATIKKGCTRAFKEIAKWLGADKPTTVDPVKREEFIKQLGYIFLEERADGKGMPEVGWKPF